MNPFEVLEDIQRRTADAIIAQSGLGHDGLRRNLRELLTGTDVRAGALLQQPVIEGAHPFVLADSTLDGLSGSVLHPDFVRAIDELEPEHEYRFPRGRKPFRHQLEAWRLLTERDPKSVVVTSGTGSGKTECFLFPILSDLVTQAAVAGEPLEGVQAIMLYPLNALIESQQERLSAWTRPFRGRIRYGLFNGDMAKSYRAERRRQTPEQVIDREQLRSAPPPLLVTNVTMLEYMLVRAEDQPIIDASRGKLKWIVLDEAHSLVGAAAAEIALLLRRTMLAFGVSPDDVRFIATSATIGSGPDIQAQLQKFLADVAGVSEDRVHVVQGDRLMPARPRPPQPTAPPTSLATAAPDILYEALGTNPETWALVERLFRGGVPLSDFAPAAAAFGTTASQLISALSRAARRHPSGDEERLAPMRLHSFERAVPGLWSCINPACEKAVPDWPFGAILSDRADRCPHCSAPVLELISCTECGEVYLEGVESGTHLSAPVRNPPRDEFAFDSAHEADSVTETDGSEQGEEDVDPLAEELGPSLDHLFAANPTSDARPFWLEHAAAGWRVVDGPGERSIAFRAEHHGGYSTCPHCIPAGGRKEILRPVRFGAPFILGNAAPILLEAVAPSATIPGEKLPSGGRRLLSFTDSRQGTARMAAKLQTESERNFVRSFVYHQVQSSMQAVGGDTEPVTKLRDTIAALETAYAANPLPALASLLESHRNDLRKLTHGSRDGLGWGELIGRLAERPEVESWILPVWQARDEALFPDSVRLAEFLLMREFDRRPKRATSLETLGLAKLRNPATASLTESHLPAPLRARGKTVDDWRSYLDTVLTHFVRNNRFSSIDNERLHWISHRAVRRSLVGPDGSTDGNTALRAWPDGHFRANPRSRPVALLLRGLGLTLDSAADRTDLDECLRTAWRQLQATFAADPERRIFDFSKTYVAPLTEAFWCPVTRRVLDCAPFGLTPYGLDDPSDERRRAAPIVMPRHPGPLLGDVDVVQAREGIREWLSSDVIAVLRTSGAWTNISDRIALFSEYARSAEHSAQQESGRLRRYEREFKAGRINVLNCSTTMEMGVDIGSVSSVMMTNVPPSIANYRQRVGRAGRRGQALALAFTFCKDRPLDRDAFADPQAFLQRTMAAPRVTLSSRPIVQRHVNAFLLGSFMRERAGDTLRMQVGAFLGCPDDPKLARPLRTERPVATFLDWLELPSTALAHSDAIAKLTRRSVLEGDGGLLDATAETIEQVEARFVAEWSGLVTLAKEEDLRDAAKSRMAIELKRLCGEFLLGGLADRGFLPGHGFPTDVVSFMPGKEFKLPIENPVDGNRQYRTVGPQRSLDIAIRDYAPGSEIVLDGLVHRSAGVTLNWKRPASEANLAEIQSLRRHWHCRDCGESDVSLPPDQCPGCGSTHLHTLEFLRPAGFSVDPRVRAHAETDILSYVAPEDPVVSVRGAPWKSLPLPELGRYRSTREGLVFYCNSGGPGKDGFDLCLECGRAEAHDSAAQGSALLDHKPLRFRQGLDRCPGNDKPFAVQRVSLGLETTTDVFELQLARRLSRAGAHALVIAIREALASELGIESDEMGFAVDGRQSALGAPAISLFLFDRATGGAGFAVSLEDRIRDVFLRAERVLDCRTPGCVQGCAACVLTSDAPSGKDDLDRRAALNYMRQHLRLPTDLPAANRFVDSAQLSLSVPDEIQRELGQVAKSELTIFLPPKQSLASLQEWPLALDRFRNWSRAGHFLRLVLDPADLVELSAADRLALRDFALRYDVVLGTGSPPTFLGNAIAFVTVGRNSEARHVWVTNEVDSSVAGPSWGQPLDMPLAHAGLAVSLSIQPVALEKLLPKTGAGYRAIEKELDVELAAFGTKAASMILALIAECGIDLTERKKIKATYKDPFVSSPLVARLLVDTVSKLIVSAGLDLTSLEIETRPPRSDSSRSGPWQALHDWRDGSEAKEVVELLGKQRGLHVVVRHADVPHGRYLVLEMGEQSQVTLVFDQGFGAWVPRRGTVLKHDFSAASSDQARRLVTLNGYLERRGVGNSYLVAFAGVS